MKRRIRVVAALIPPPSSAGPQAAGAPVVAPVARYLVQQRLPGGARADLWEFPGGKVEPSETDEAALARECEEELGVVLAVGARRWSTVHEYADLVVDLVLYDGSIRSGEPRPLGAQALAYLTPEEMRGRPFCEADLPLIERLVEASSGRPRVDAANAAPTGASRGT